MWNSLDQNLERYQELERQMADPAVISDPGRFTRAVKEHGRLARVVKPYQSLQSLEDEIKQAETLLAAESEAEMRGYAEEELAGLRRRHEEMRGQLEDMLLESTDDDYDSVIME